MIVRNEPPKRDIDLMWIVPLTIIVILFLIMAYGEGFPATIVEFSRYLLLSLQIFIFKRICTFIPDLLYWMNYKKRYISFWKIILNNFHFTGEIWCYIVLVPVMFVYSNSINLESVRPNVPNTLIGNLGLAATVMFLQSRGMDEHPTKKAIEIEQSSCSKASGFYYGYLKIILPTLKNKIDDYIDENHVAESFKVKKLLILIPSSAVLFDNISRLDSPYIEDGKHLLEYVCDRAFVVNRSYKNTVYKIKHPKTKERFYTVFEGATPLKTFFEQCREDKMLKNYTHETVYAFYNTLKKLLENDHEIKDDVELLYYEDDKKPGHGSGNTKLHDIILDRLNYIITEQERENLKYQ